MLEAVSLESPSLSVKVAEESNAEDGEASAGDGEGGAEDVGVDVADVEGLASFGEDG